MVFFVLKHAAPNNENSSDFLESPLVPITDEFYAEVALPDAAELKTFMSYLDNKGRGRLNEEIEVKQVIKTLKGAYVAVERKAG